MSRFPFLFLLILFVISSALAQTEEGPQALTPVAPVMVTDPLEIEDLENVYKDMLTFSEYMATCTSKSRAYAVMADCLCQRREDFYALYYKFSDLMVKYPKFDDVTVSYKRPGNDTPSEVNLGVFKNRLVRFEPHMCRTKMK